MNWTMIMVVSAVIVAVGSALWAVFTTGRDKYSYHRHYTQAGFSPELPEDLGANRKYL